MQIRKAQPDDLDRIIRLYQQLNPNDPPSPGTDVISATWREILSTPQVHFYVVEEDGKLLCTCVLTIVPNLSRGCAPYGLIENVVTDQQFRRQGVATKLLKSVLNHAWAKGCYKVMLLTGSKRPETLSFYENAGFQSGVKTGFVAHPRGE
jgi:N-acetylglutamate synthase-like GNAT family acetyltransferase